MSTGQHALERSISQLSIGLTRESAARERVAPTKVQERIERFQIRLTGMAADLPDWQDIELAFDTMFSPATGNSSSTLKYPQLSGGYERESGGLVLATAVVSEWRFNDASLIEGAIVSIGAIAPGQQVDFRGYYHLTFEGLGALLQTSPTGD